MSQIQQTNPAYLRLDYSRSDQYIYPDPPKLSFWQKIGRGLGKFMSVLGPIGAAVTAVALPGIGLPIAAGIYGLSQFSSDQLVKAQTKDQIDMANQPQPTQVFLPGLFDSAPLDIGSISTDFIAPSSLEANISEVLVNRGGAQFENMNKIE